MAPRACLRLTLKPLVFTPVSLLRLQGQTCRQGPDLICVTHWLACRLHAVGELSTFGEPKRHVIIHLFQNNMKESYLLVLMYYPTYYKKKIPCGNKNKMEKNWSALTTTMQNETFRRENMASPQ